jgi:methylenetetrahydrofolate reductase (NADPH)
VLLCCVSLLPCREKHGDYFGIGVAGYPEAHPDFIVDDAEQMKKNYWDSLAYLKEKVRCYVTLLLS